MIPKKDLIICNEIINNIDINEAREKAKTAKEWAELSLQKRKKYNEERSKTLHVAEKHAYIS